MEKFADTLTEKLIERAEREARPIHRGVLEVLKGKLKGDPSIMLDALTSSLETCSLELKKRET